MSQLSEHWTRENLAWIAGLLEGEGTFTSGHLSHPSFNLRCAMTDEDIVRRLHRLSGIGKVYGPYSRPRRKPVFIWASQVSWESYALAMAIAPWLGERRREQMITATRKWMT